MFPVALCLCALIGGIAPSAIPMWEYLSKDEKMSYLYSMFANQVEEFCEFSNMNNCNKELLKFGLGKLKDMPEDHLDTMDPYQRGAHTLIWDSMMEGHEMMSKKPKTRASTTTAKPNSYDDQSFGQDYQPQASAKIETVVYKTAPPPKGFVYTIQNGPSQYRQPFGAAKNTYQAGYDYQGATLTGPMVVKVHLDGTPVQEPSNLPHDEDLRQYQMSKARIPTF